MVIIFLTVIDREVINMKRYNIRCNRVITSGIAGRIRLIKWLSSVICICVVGFIVISTYNQKNIMRY